VLRRWRAGEPLCSRKARSRSRRMRARESGQVVAVQIRRAITSNSLAASTLLKRDVAIASLRRGQAPGWPSGIRKTGRRRSRTRVKFWQPRRPVATGPSVNFMMLPLCTRVDALRLCRAWRRPIAAGASAARTTRWLIGFRRRPTSTGPRRVSARRGLREPIATPAHAAIAAETDLLELLRESFAKKSRIFCRIPAVAGAYRCRRRCLRVLAEDHHVAYRGAHRRLEAFVQRTGRRRDRASIDVAHTFRERMPPPNGVVRGPLSQPDNDGRHRPSGFGQDQLSNA